MVTVVAFLGVVARCALVSLLRPGCKALWCNDVVSPLLHVELRAVSPTSMEEGEKAPSVTLAMESLGTLWLRQSV
jgi:hypothetical protein